jgi:hypothetical protein
MTEATLTRFLKIHSKKKIPGETGEEAALLYGR